MALLDSPLLLPLYEYVYSSWALPLPFESETEAKSLPPF